MSRRTCASVGPTVSGGREKRPSIEGGSSEASEVDGGGGLGEVLFILKEEENEYYLVRRVQLWRCPNLEPPCSWSHLNQSSSVTKVLAPRVTVEELLVVT